MWLTHGWDALTDFTRANSVRTVFAGNLHAGCCEPFTVYRNQGR